MLKTSDYKEEILKLYNAGVYPVEIADKLGFKYHQPVYNLLKKEGVFEAKQIVYKRKYTLDEDYFQTIDSPIKAYILGFICADGHVSHDRITISLSSKDIDILERIKLELNSNVPIKFSLRENPYKKGKQFCEMCTVQFSSVRLAKPLIKAGLASDKTYTLCSKILEIVQKEFIRDFLRGYFDGDGNVLWGKKYNSGMKYNINICGNEEFLLNTYQLYFPSTNKMYFDKKSKQTFIWKLSSKQKVKEFLEFLYKDSNIYLQRKYKEYLNTLM